MSKGLWRILLVVTGMVACGYVFIVSIDLWKCFQLSTEIPAQVIHWDLVPKRSTFALKATYSYTHRGKNFTGTNFLPKPYHLNRRSAEMEIEKMEGMKWTAWINDHHPAYSTLYNSFPFRKACYAVCLLGIFLYFVYLKFHLELLSSKM